MAMTGQLQSACDIAKDERVTVQAVYDAMRRGEITPAVTTKGGRKLFTPEEVERWKSKRAMRKRAR